MAYERTQLLAPAVASAAAVHAAVALLATAQTITTDITDPDCYRVVSVTGNQAGITGDVVVVGTDWNGTELSDTIALAGTSTVDGARAFKNIESFIVPVLDAAGDEVSIGCADVFGLYGTVAAGGDVMLQERAVSGATEFTIEAVGTVDATYGTVAATIVTGDRIRWTYLDAGTSGAGSSLLVTLDEVKAWIREDTSYSDVQILAILESASTKLRDKIDPFAGTDERYSGRGFDRLLLNRHPLWTVRSVTIDGVAITDFTQEGWWLYRTTPEVWPAGTRNVIVGYEAASVRADLKEACVNLTRHGINLQLRTHFVNFPDGGGVGPERAWPAGVLETIDLIRGPVIA